MCFRFINVSFNMKSKVANVFFFKNIGLHEGD